MRSSILSLIVWLVICTVALVGYSYWYSVISDSSTTVATLQNEIDTKTQTSARIAAARAAFAEIAGDESVVQGYFVPESGVVAFIDDLESRAQKQSAAMKVLSVSVTGTTKPTLILSLSMDGTFDSVMRSVGAIEYSPYDLIISKLVLAKTEKSTWHADLGLVVGSVPSTATSSASTKKP